MLFLLSLLSLASAAVYDGTAKSKEGFAFVGKFCFDKAFVRDDVAGTVIVNLTVPGFKEMKQTDQESYKDYELWLFSDEKSSWPAIYQTGISCQDARTKAKNYKSETGDITPQFKVNFDANGEFSTGEARIVQNIRPRFWFMALAHCGDGAIVKDVKYNTHWVNSQRNWGKELGANEAGLNTLFLCCFLVYAPFMIVHFYGVVQLSKKLEFVHPMVKLFAVIVVLQFGVITTNMLHWLAYGGNGKGIPVLVPVAECLDILVRSLFVLMLMLISQGWTITGDELTGKKLVLATVGAFFVFSGLISLWKFAQFDPAATGPGVAVMIFTVFVNIVWLFFAGWFAFCIVNSYKKEDNPVKKTLFRNLGIVFSPWFFGVPLVSVLTLVIAVWVALKAYTTASVLFSLFGFFVMSFLLWPSRAEEYFNISTPDVMQAQIDTYEQL